MCSFYTSFLGTNDNKNLSRKLNGMNPDRTDFNGSQLGKMKKYIHTCPCHKIYRVEAVGLSIASYAKKIPNFFNHVKFGAIS